MKFRIGDIVICLDSDGSDARHSFRAGREYKVVEVYGDPSDPRIGVICLLTGLRNGWTAKRFVLKNPRPLSHLPDFL